DIRAVREAIAFVLQLLENGDTAQLRLDMPDAPHVRNDIFAEQDPQRLHFRLYTLAMEDAYHALHIAHALLKDASVERRWVAAILLANLHMPEADATLLEALEDDDLRVVTVAANALHSALNRFLVDVLQGLPADTFERVERLISRLPQNPK